MVKEEDESRADDDDDESPLEALIKRSVSYAMEAKRPRTLAAGAASLESKSKIKPI